jgi:Zn-finger nucleic acid-binding protein
MIDRCSYCDGLWFDKGEVLDAIRRAKLEELPAVPEGFRLSHNGPAGSCPRCSTTMETVVSPSAPAVEYDHCPSCEGVWFDAAEANAYGNEHVGLLALMIREFG